MGHRAPTDINRHLGRRFEQRGFAGAPPPAHTRIRDKDGVKREVTATGTTAAAAERALREKLADRATPTRQAITADTTIATLAALWLTFLRDEGQIEATTINEYERVLDKVVIPELGGLRLREVTTSRLELFLVRLRATSVSRQRKTKVVMGAMLGMAVRHDALAVNPVQQTSRIHRERSETRSLTREDLTTVREALRAWTAKQRPGPTASIDMADIIDLMLATGARIGEISRCAGSTSHSTPPSEPHDQRNDQDRAGQRHVPQAQPEVRHQREDGRSSGIRHRSAQAPSGGGGRTRMTRCSRHATAPGCRSTTSSAAGARSARTPALTGSRLTRSARRWRRSSRSGSTPRRPLSSSATPPPPSLRVYISKPAIAADVAHVLDELAEADPRGRPEYFGNKWGIAPPGSNERPAPTQRFRRSEPVPSVGLTGFEPATP